MRGARLLDCHIHHNQGRAVWFDWDCLAAVVEGCLIHHNSNEGIAYEASAEGRFRDCLIGFNTTSGWREPGVWSADLVAAVTPTTAWSRAARSSPTAAARSRLRTTPGTRTARRRSSGATIPGRSMACATGSPTTPSSCWAPPRPGARRQRAAGRGRGQRQQHLGAEPLAGGPGRPGPADLVLASAGGTSSARSRSTPISPRSCRPRSAAEPGGQPQGLYRCSRSSDGVGPVRRSAGPTGMYGRGTGVGCWSWSARDDGAVDLARGGVEWALGA